MKHYVKNQSEFFISASSVTDLMNNLLNEYPALLPHLFDSAGKLRRHYNVFVNGTHIRDLDGMDTLLKDEDKVILMASAAGG